MGRIHGNVWVSIGIAAFLRKANHIWAVSGAFFDNELRSTMEHKKNITTEKQKLQNSREFMGRIEHNKGHQYLVVLHLK
jgi:hypothetical protein